MKDLLKLALNDAFILLEKQVPQTKKETKEVNIDDVKPIELLSFMKENNIPDDAYFGTEESQTLGSYTFVFLYYQIDIPTTDKDKLKFKRKRFTDIAFKFVYDLLTKNDYKRIPFNSSFYKEFKDTTVYDMYINKEFDRLVKYYSLYFIK